MNQMNEIGNDFGTDTNGGQTDWNGGFVEGDAADPVYVPDTPRNHTAMVLLGICVLSMLGVYMIGLRQKPKEASAQEKEVEMEVDSRLAKLAVMNSGQAKKMFRDTENMVQAFYDYPAQQQVAVDDLNKNPFYRFNTEVENKDEIEKEKNRAQLQKELTRKASLLQLQSVLQGPEGSKCLINGGIYAVNQKVANTFTITSINKNNVVLRFGEFEVVLEM